MVWPEAAIIYIVMTIGALFILPGLMATVSYFLHPKDESGKRPLFPIEAAEGVVVHELCHFKVPSHSRAFYEEMAKILPDHRARRKLLSQY